jgi:hypothetical protein
VLEERQEITWTGAGHPPERLPTIRGKPGETAQELRSKDDMSEEAEMDLPAFVVFGSSR